MKYFTISELCASDVAAHRELHNSPSLAAQRRLRTLVDKVLDPAREYIGVPVIVNSGYRCRELNRLVGGVPDSAHLYGCAADITCDIRLLPALFEFIRGTLDFDQLIYYRSRGFLHVSYLNEALNRCQVIVKS